MIQRVVVFAALGAVLALPAGRARADEAGLGVGEPHHQFAAYGILGLGIPVGSYGVEAVLRLAPAFEISAGVGVGMTALIARSGSPLQWAVMPRVRAGKDERNTFTLGIGASGGNVGEIPLFCDCDTSPTYPTHYWLWTNVEAGGEHWWRNNIALRYFAGVAVGCRTDAGCNSVIGYPYTGVGIGRAF
ncbi:MAG TPA: hypothetical protein VIF57_09015 [Polyangia bacterium]|jgi:hypothetical protein